MPRVLLIIGVLGLVGFAIYKIWKGYIKPANACDKCNGEGYWEGLRSKEKCDQCLGTGVFPPKR
jgi:DnaJ-class molecular chaperone